MKKRNQKEIKKTIKITLGVITFLLTLIIILFAAAILIDRELVDLENRKIILNAAVTFGSIVSVVMLTKIDRGERLVNTLITCGVLIILQLIILITSGFKIDSCKNQLITDCFILIGSAIGVIITSKKNRKKRIVR